MEAWHSCRCGIISFCCCAASDPHVTHKKRLSPLIEAETDKRKALWQSPLGRQLKLLLPKKSGFVSHGRGLVTVLLSHSCRSDSPGSYQVWNYVQRPGKPGSTTCSHALLVKRALHSQSEGILVAAFSSR